MRQAVAWLAVCACSYNAPTAVTGDDQPESDAPGVDIDAPVVPDDGPAPCTPFEYGDVCALTPGSALVISSVEALDTDDDPRCVSFPQSAGPDACLIYRTSIEITATGALVVTGARPLLLAATTIDIGGKLDGSSRRDTASGPGANFASCAHVATPEADGGGGGGGAGGSFAALGGHGGTGDTDQSSGAPGNAARGEAGASVEVPAFLRGGCSGQRGGNGSTGENGGDPGPSGGAIGLLAFQQIAVSSGILVNGGGGEGGDTQAGAGGAGSGGMLVLESPSVVVSGILAANGGGGGEGGNRHNSVNIDGNDGADGTATGAAPGGSGATPFGGPGGSGSFASTIAGISGTDSIVGGGGGGGAAGYIRVIGTLQMTGTASPPITQ